MLVRDAQEINLFALRSLTHYALNNDERATYSRFPFTKVMWRVRVRLTLMLAAAANATATPAPARHLWFTNVFSRRAFRYPAHAAGVAGYRMVFVLSSRPVMSRFRRGVRRGKDGGTIPCRCAARGGEPSLHFRFAFLTGQARPLAPADAGRW
jgi:hypothetical protein